MTTLFLLTGYSSGLGQAVLKHLLKVKDPAARFVLVGRQPPEAYDIRTCHQRADFLSPTESARAVRFAMQANCSQLVKEAVLIHCAGIARTRFPGEVLTVNFTSVVTMCEE